VVVSPPYLGESEIQQATGASGVAGQAIRQQLDLLSSNAVLIAD
jgi:hypothetical protein